MGWINTLFDVAQLSAELYNVKQVGDLKKQGANAQAIQTIMKILRDRIFEYNKTAKNILEAETGNPRAAAGAMRVLELRLMDSGITPEIFRDSGLSDMEYVDQTYRLIQGNSQRMYAQLSPEDQDALNRMASSADKLPEYSYYLANHKDYRGYLEAKGIFESSPWMASQGAVTGLGCMAFLVVTGIGFAISANNPRSYLPFVLLIAVVAFQFYIGSKARGIRKAKKTLDALETKLDLEQLEETHAAFHGSLDAVHLSHDNAQAELQSFFGDATFLLA